MNGVYYTIYNNIRDRDAGVKPVSRLISLTAEQEYDEIKYREETEIYTEKKR